MSLKISNVFNFADQIQISSLNHRLTRSQVINSNIANAETPGFRALEYDFEKQLQSLTSTTGQESLKVTDLRHKRNSFTEASGKIDPDVYMRPTESVGHDGNTVEIDKEMASMAQNQILYRATIESLSRKIGLLKYAIQGGRA